MNDTIKLVARVLLAANTRSHGRSHGRSTLPQGTTPVPLPGSSAAKTPTSRTGMLARAETVTLARSGAEIATAGSEAPTVAAERPLWKLAQK